MENVVKIKVVGVGGAGYSIVNRMIASGIDGVSYLTIDTCTKTEKISEIHESLQIGENLTNGLGTMALAPVTNQRLEKKQRMTHAVRSRHY